MRRYYFLIAALLLATAWLCFSRINGITVVQLDDTGSVKITVNFYIPVEQKGAENKIHLTSERPGTNVIKSIRWVDDTILQIFAVEEGLPRGFKTRLYLEPLKTQIPGVYKSVKAYYRANVAPFLTGLSPVAPTGGPVVLNFSTPIKKESLQKGLKTDFEYELRPYYIPLPEGGAFTDFSRWQVIPREKLEPGSRHKINFHGDLENILGLRRTTEFYREFRVADVPRVISTEPGDGQTDVKLYMPIEIKFDQDMSEVTVKVSGMSGDVEVDGRTVKFKPHAVFAPGETYSVLVRGKSIFGEEMKPYEFKFSTLDMGEKLWVEVNLRRLQKVVVYRGGRAIKTMLASGGLPGPENETPLGYFTIKDRGKSFWSERFGEGALYWIRIKDNYLFHSVPRDREGNIIEEEHKKLGIPASHGCIRLKDEDARWFYENIPEGTTVIIHD